MSESTVEPSLEWPVKAYKNLRFLNSFSARNIRVLCEMTEPGLRFAEEHIEDTIVLFGSARIVSEKIAKMRLEEVQASIEDINNPTVEEKNALRLAQSTIKSAPYYEMAAKLAEELTKWSLSLNPERQRRFVVCSGGGPGRGCRRPSVRLDRSRP